ncbi:alpha/beta fold hydrolase [Antrihabitans sp. YC3-6]|uniref:Alpha/beta fold hydrolase n=1 Tax=Antrihabitans stalagmiti TaxID=2799499 RepID=A0A934NV29_9NOCA|nr:alpha/beta fold hydrolase [Antrihabitans stalagmiti]MBJ8341824.1 alpha/beta fold hydrolase [Antrihabitans stalagmiti]
MNRIEVTFQSGSDTCAAWLYRPTSDSDGPPKPLVVMGHGLGANREMGIDPYAQRFVAAGFLVLAFDYRGFGASTGEPRQILDIKAQRADWHAAIAYARTVPGVDPSRIALWGSSFGGGHVLAVAADDPTIAAVVSQCPFTDGIASALAVGPVTLARLSFRAVLDLVGSVVGRPPVMVALAGEHGDAALMSAHDVVAGYGALSAQSPLYRPEVAARIALHVPLDAPGRKAKKLAMPVFYAICDKDTVAPAGRTAKVAANTPRGVVKHYPVGHFDIYVGEPFEQTVKDQTEFLVANLKP